jgi:hypothetical protein
MLAGIHAGRDPCWQGPCWQGSMLAGIHAGRDPCWQGSMLAGIHAGRDPCWQRSMAPQPHCRAPTPPPGPRPRPGAPQRAGPGCAGGGGGRAGAFGCDWHGARLRAAAPRSAAAHTPVSTYPRFVFARAVTGPFLLFPLFPLAVGRICSAPRATCPPPLDRAWASSIAPRSHWPRERHAPPFATCRGFCFAKGFFRVGGIPPHAPAGDTRNKGAHAPSQPPCASARVVLPAA